MNIDKWEESAEKQFNIFKEQNPIIPKKYIEPFKLGFIKGIKWQSERMYSEKDMIDFATFRNGGDVREEFKLWKEQKIKTIYYE